MSRTQACDCWNCVPPEGLNSSAAASASTAVTIVVSSAKAPRTRSPSGRISASSAPPSGTSQSSVDVQEPLMRRR